ncbi:MAG: hypothetical protein M0Z56_07275 [Desulfobacteraceae bacterium]|nr:hypothetical protein [Desulfobacteraceae bacterium]
MISAYLTHKAERETAGIPPRPLTADQASALVDLLQKPEGQDAGLLLDLITHRVPAGVDEAAQVKAGFLEQIAMGKARSPLISPEQAVFLLSTMGGGYNTQPLIRLLDHDALAVHAAKGLSGSILIFDAFD